jgi:alkylhydroperoxidase family enzyme
MRRHFGSGAAGLCARDGIFKAYSKRFQAKWIPVRVKKTRQTRKLEPGSDSIRTGLARARWARTPPAVARARPAGYCFERSLRKAAATTEKPLGRAMARIDYCDTSKSNERTREILGKNRNANIFRMMAHSPSYFEQYCRLGGAIRHKGELDPVVRELAITRTGILCEAPYEVVAHKRIGKNVGVTDEQNEALENWKSATCFNELQRAALAFTDEIVRLSRPTDATFGAVASRLTPAALVELQLSVGFYIMTSKFLETFAIDMQPVSEVV